MAQKRKTATAAPTTRRRKNKMLVKYSKIAVVGLVAIAASIYIYTFVAGLF